MILKCVKCLKCEDVIFSRNEDVRTICSCGNIAAFGGQAERGVYFKEGDSYKFIDLPLVGTIKMISKKYPNGRVISNEN